LRIDEEFNRFTEKFGATDLSPTSIWKEFDEIDIGGNIYPLGIGSTPHTQFDKFHYAQVNGNRIPFNGHRNLFKIEIAQHNCLKRHPNEIAKGCSAKVYVDGLEIWQKYCKDIHTAANLAEKYVDEIKDHLDWFPLHVGDYLGKRIGYYNLESEIVEILVSTSKLVIQLIDGTIFPRRLDRDPANYIPSNYKEISILDPAISWEIYE
jgi:hypothetical protein